MIIRLQTRCGCVRLVEVERTTLMETYEVAILEDVTMFTVDSREIRSIKRRFRYRGEDAQGVPIFLEEL